MRIIGCLLAFTIVCSCSLSVTEGNGNIITSNGKLSPYSNLQVGGSMLLEYQYDSVFSYELHMDENLLDLIIFESQNQTLMVRTKGRYRPSERVKLVIYSPTPKHIDLAGAVEFSTLSTLTTDSLRLSLSGATRANITLAVKQLHTAMSGSSHIMAKGTAVTHRLDMAGSTKIDALSLFTERLNVQIGGASLARVNASNTIYVKPSGASRLEYTGNANIIADDAQNIFIHPYKP